MTRIELTDNIMSAIMKLTNSNPGAMTVCMILLEKTPEIDPDNTLGGLGNLLSLDTYGIYESRIWMLYKDVCGQNITKTMAILRACQLGILKINELNFAIDNYGKGIDINEIHNVVCNRLPRFKKE